MKKISLGQLISAVALLANIAFSSQAQASYHVTYGSSAGQTCGGFSVDGSRIVYTKLNPIRVFFKEIASLHVLYRPDACGRYFSNGQWKVKYAAILYNFKYQRPGQNPVTAGSFIVYSSNTVTRAGVKFVDKTTSQTLLDNIAPLSADTDVWVETRYFNAETQQWETGNQAGGEWTSSP